MINQNPSDRSHPTASIRTCPAQTQKHPSPDTAPMSFDHANINTINQLKLKLKTTQKRNGTLLKENSILQSEILKLQQHIRMLDVKRTNTNETIMQLQTKLAKKDRAAYKQTRVRTSETSVQCQIISPFHIETFQSLLKAEREKNDLLTQTIQHSKLLWDKETSDRDSKEYDSESDTTHDYEFESDTTPDYEEEVQMSELNIQSCQPETTGSMQQLNNPQECENANWHQSTKSKEKYSARLGLDQAKANNFLNYLWQCSNRLIATILKNQ